MPYRKSQADKRDIDRLYPHRVEITIPEKGLGLRLSAMHDFMKAMDWAHVSRSTREIGVKEAMCWRFVDAADADAFRVEFGGERVTQW